MNRMRLLGQQERPLKKQGQRQNNETLGREEENQLGPEEGG